MGKLDNKIAIITGAASGMGNATARRAAEYGGIVNLFDFSPAVMEKAEELRALGYEATGYQVDVSKQDQVRTACDKVFEQYGRVDVLVNAAGIGRYNRLTDNDCDQKMNQEFSVNFGGVWNTCKCIFPEMVKAGYGKIVNFASVTGCLVADNGLISYGATKGAVLAFTKELALEGGEFNITVNAVLPGTIKTPMVTRMAEKTFPDDPDRFYKSIAECIPMKRLGRPEEAAEVVCFLASDESSYVTGVGLPFDGGNTVPEMNQIPVSSYRE